MSLFRNGKQPGLFIFDLHGFNKFVQAIFKVITLTEEWI